MTDVRVLDSESLKMQASRYFDRPSLSSPVFIGDDTLVILDDRSGVPQVSQLDATTGEIRSVTSFGERVLSLIGSLSGTIAFGMDNGGDERQQVWRLSTDSDVPSQVTHRPDAMHEPGALSRDGSLVLLKSNARNESTFDIVALDLTTGDSEIWLEDAGTAAPVGLSQDKRRALVIRANTNLDADLWLLDRETGETTNLTAHDGEAWLTAAAFSPDEQSVLYLSNEGGEFLRLVRQDLATGEREVELEDPGHDVEAFRISPDGRYLSAAINEHGWSRVELHSLVDRRGSLTLGELPRGTVDRFTWSPDSSKVAFGFSTAEDPSAIVVVETSGEFVTISAESPDHRPQTATPELISFPTFDEREIPSFLLKPEGEGPFPVLVEIHGGPESQRRLQYSSAIPTDQFIQSLGIAVLTLNVRGSTGYGKSYSHLDDKDLRLDSVKDVEAAVAWLRTRDDIIPDRIAVMGQSYGGFMTLASITFHPDLWTAAVDVVGIANFVSFLERTGPWRRKHRSEEYGFLEQDRELLERISPLNYVDRIKVPLFVIHGRNDPRVPLFEAEQIVAALEDRGQEVHLRVFDDEGHGLSKRRNRIDGYAEAAGFLARHLLA
jgi:dipeptidyl aminopeptidase/acylaminoacyl peptidase